MGPKKGKKGKGEPEADLDGPPLPEGMVPDMAPTVQQKSESLLANTVLSDMVTALEETKLNLTMNVKSLKEDLTVQKKDQQDVYYYLNKKCDDAYEIIASLEEQLLTEQADREVAEKMYEDKIDNMSRHFAMEGKKLNEKIADMKSKMGEAEEFLRHRTELENQASKYKKMYEHQKAKSKEALKEMEHQFDLARNKMLKAESERIAKIENEMDMRVRRMLPQKTVDTMLKNNAIEEEMSFQSKQADEVLIYNANVMDKGAKYKMELELAKALEHEMNSKLTMYKSLVKQLNTAISKGEQKRESIQTELNHYREEVSKWENKYLSLNSRVEQQKMDKEECWRYLVDKHRKFKRWAADKANNVVTSNNRQGNDSPIMMPILDSAEGPIALGEAGFVASVINNSSEIDGNPFQYNDSAGEYSSNDGTNQYSAIERTYASAFSVGQMLDHNTPSTDNVIGNGNYNPELGESSVERLDNSFVEIVDEGSLSGRENNALTNGGVPMQLSHFVDMCVSVLRNYPFLRRDFPELARIFQQHKTKEKEKKESVVFFPSVQSPPQKATTPIKASPHANMKSPIKKKVGEGVIKVDMGVQTDPYRPRANGETVWMTGMADDRSVNSMSTTEQKFRQIMLDKARAEGLGDNNGDERSITSWSTEKLADRILATQSTSAMPPGDKYLSSASSTYNKKGRHVGYSGKYNSNASVSGYSVSSSNGSYTGNKPPQQMNMRYIVTDQLIGMRKKKADSYEKLTTKQRKHLAVQGKIKQFNRRERESRNRYREANSNSPASSVSMSPRLDKDDDSTIFTVSPREDMDDDL